MKQAIRAYHNITVTPEFKEMERLRSLARHNEASALRHARNEESKRWQSVGADKDAKLADKDAKLADKDAKLADKDAKLADKDAKLADKDAEITRLRNLLEQN
jgi:hypothetical protein